MSKGCVPGFALALAAAMLAAVPAMGQPATPGEVARDGNRKPACGCYVCGTLLTMSFGIADCAGILAEDACGGSLSGLPQANRNGFCQRLEVQFGADSLRNECRAIAPYCGPDGTTAKSPAGGGAPNPGQSGTAPGGQGPTASKEPPGKSAPGTSKPAPTPFVAGSPGQAPATPTAAGKP